MKITLEFDAQSARIVEAENQSALESAEDGGPPPEVLLKNLGADDISSDTAGSELSAVDTGGPPAWLLEEIDRDGAAQRTSSSLKFVEEGNGNAMDGGGPPTR
jgi:hypothetical protein